jgi:hypothetical protein
MAWLSGWPYRRKITISGSSGAGTNYQVLLKIGESSGATGCDFHLDGKSANFPSGMNQGGDLRFTADDGVTLLSFWVETVRGTSPNRTAYVWVKVSADLGTDRVIYCYFGNPNATNASDATNTFLAYEGFESGTLGLFKNVYDNDYFSVSSTIKKEGSYGAQDYDPSSTARGGRFSDPNTFWAQNKVAIEFWMMSNATSNSGGFFASFFTKDGYLRAEVGIRDTDVFTYWNGSFTNFGSAEKNTWYKCVVELDYDNLTWNFRIYDSNYNLLYSYSNLAMGSLAISSADVMMSSSSPFVGYCYWDEFFSRKWVSPEPAFSSADRIEVFPSNRRLLLMPI